MNSINGSDKFTTITIIVSPVILYSAYLPKKLRMAYTELRLPVKRFLKEEYI